MLIAAQRTPEACFADLPGYLTWRTWKALKACVCTTLTKVQRTQK